jgi:hypothetical protein
MGWKKLFFNPPLDSLERKKIPVIISKGAFATK